MAAQVLLKNSYLFPKNSQSLGMPWENCAKEGKDWGSDRRGTFLLDGGWERGARTKNECNIRKAFYATMHHRAM